MARTGPITKDTSTVQLGLSQIRISKSATHIATTTPALVAGDSMGAMASTALNSESEYWDLESGFPLGLDATFPLRETNTMECAFREITPKNLAISRGIDPFSDMAAVILAGSSVTTSGTVVEGNLAVDDLGGVVTDTWMVVFSSATAYDVYGTVTGDVGNGTTSVAFEPDNGGQDYFVIGAGTFTGTWAAGDTFSFTTTAFVAGTSAYADNHVGSIPLGSLAAPKFLRVEAIYTFPDPTYQMAIIFPRANVVSNLALDQQPEDSAAVTMTIKSMGASSDNDGGNAAWDSMPNGQILFTSS